MLAFPTLSDPDGAVTEAFGVTYEVPSALRPLYVRWGQDLPRLNKSGTWRIPFPATFVIGMDGRVALADLPLTVYARREPASVIELLESMQTPA